MALGEKIGRKLKGGEVIVLVGDLGSGKTTFVKGLAKGMGSADLVTSPSFTIRNEYRAGDLTLRHYDFYRLKEAGVLNEELNETINDSNFVAVIEWPAIVISGLSANKIEVDINITNADGRHFSFHFAPGFDYLTP